MVPLSPPWADRRQAGEALATHLLRQVPIPEPRLGLGLPRGGVVVAAPLAAALGAPLLSWAVRKIVLPEAPEVAIGAVAAGVSGPMVIWDAPERLPAGLSRADRLALVREPWQELLRRQHLYGDPEPAALTDHWLVVVDDGIATGLTIRAALGALRDRRPRGMVLAVPVADRQVMTELRPLIERMVVLHPVVGLRAVGDHYRHFEPVEDQQVLATLAAARRHQAQAIP